MSDPRKEEQAKRLAEQAKRIADLLPPGSSDELADPLVPAKKRRKTKKQKHMESIERHFPRKKNFQGFDMARCRHEASIGDYVYVPKNYGSTSAGKLWRDLRFCPQCKLKPCINVEYFEEINRHCFDQCWKHERTLEDGKKSSILALLKRMENNTVKLLVRHFGREYVKRVGTPGCVIEDTQDYLSRWQLDH